MSLTCIIIKLSNEVYRLKLKTDGVDDFNFCIIIRLYIRVFKTSLYIW